MSIRSRALIVLLVLGAAVGGVLYRRAVLASPEYSLRELQSAIRERNRLAFEDYVDMEAISDQLVNAVMDQAVLRGVKESNNGWGVIGTALGAGLVEKTKPALANALRDAVIQAVETGRLDSLVARKQKEEPTPRLALIARSVAAEPFGFRGFTPIERGRRLAILGLQFRNDPLDTTLTIRMRMEQQRRRWRIVGLDNISQYLATVADLQERKLASVNADIDLRMAREVRLGGIRQRTRSVGWFDEYVTVYTPVENVGEGKITVAGVLLSGVETSDVGDRVLFLFRTLAPGEQGTADKLFEYNQFIDWHQQLRYGTDASLKPEIAYLVVERGATADTLRKFESWDDYLSSL